MSHPKLCLLQTIILLLNKCETFYGIDYHHHGEVDFKNLPSVFFLFLVFTETYGQQCSNGWFGDKCQYQCHCLNGALCNKTTGDCPGVCDRRWFGPQCQYRDAAYNPWVGLTDGNDLTCLVGKIMYQNFPMLEDVMFTWMRIAINRPGVFDRVKMAFLSITGTIVVPKSPLTKIYLSDTILELHGKLQHRFKTIRLDFESPETKQSICSMQVSSGRNVAIKQNASQSSTWDNAVAERAVDGKPNQWWGDGSCMHTEADDNLYWTLNLSLPVTVNMFTLLGRGDGGGLCRLNYFRLESYNGITKVQQYDETDRVSQLSYDVYPVSTSPITSVTLSVSKYRWPGNTYNCNNVNPVLSFCEMEIFGDVVCPPGKWGRDCEKACNCQVSSESCFVSTGMCPSGCKTGFQGPGCKEECSVGRWGPDCLNSCDNCLNGKCNKTSGECQSECLSGYKRPHCVEKCDLGFHGYNCIDSCPANCRNKTCNNVNGLCNECEAGYQGPVCAQVCDATLYGQNCSTPCREMCIDQLCHHITGVCEKCPHGKQISKDCSQDCDAGSHGFNCLQSCPVNCRDNICDNVDGTCTKCVAGYQGLVCKQECDATFYGEDCASQCSGRCIDQLCHHITGVCDNCPDGKQISRDCSQDADTLNLVVILVPLIFGLIVVAALIVGIWLWRKRKAQKANRQSFLNNETKDGPDVVNGHGVNLELEDNQPPNVPKATIDHYDRISLNVNEGNPDNNEHENTSRYVNVENPALNEYERTGENRESHVYTEPED